MAKYWEESFEMKFSYHRLGLEIHPSYYICVYHNVSEASFHEMVMAHLKTEQDVSKGYGCLYFNFFLYQANFNPVSCPNLSSKV